MTQAPVTGFRLSPQQRHVWQLQRDSRAYRAQVSLHLTGDLRREALEEALAGVISQHQIFRTAFQRTPGVRFPIQVVREEATARWRHLDYSDRDGAAVEKLFDKERKKPFDLDRGPVVHATLVARGAEEHVLILGLPALVADAASLQLLVRDLAAAYGAAAGSEDESVQYVQFSEWQNEMVESEEAKPGRDFWQALEVPSLHALELPFGASDAGAFAPERVPLVLEPGTAERLAELGGAEVVLLAAWRALLWRLTGESEGGVGVMSAGRQHEELADTPGLFARCLPLPWSLAAGDTFKQVVSGVAEQLGEARDFEDFYLPGEVGAIGVPACFSFDTWEDPAPRGAVTFSLVRRIAYHQRFEVSLQAADCGGELAVELHYDTGRVSAAAAEVLARRLEGFLRTVLADPDVAIGEVEILTADEEERLLRAFNDTAVEFPAEPVHRRFVEQAARTAEKVAVEFAGEEMNYAELHRRSDHLAHHLVAAGVGADDVVGIFLERSEKMIVAVLGILKAGGAYLPLDPADPAERLTFMIHDAGATRVVSRGGLVEALEAAGVDGGRIVALDSDWERIEQAPAADLTARVDPEHLAYVLYTSGSTGRPKGVAISHRGLMNYLNWATDFYRAGDGEGAPMHAPLGFDLTVTSLFTPLLSGSRVIVLAEEQGVQALGELLSKRRGMSVVKVTPAHLSLVARSFADANLSGRTGALIVGGETLYEESLKPWRRQAEETRLINEYGPTETVVGCTIFEASAAPPESGPVPIGKPIANTRVYLLDSRLRPVPEGVVGELCVGGAGLARGYLGRPGLTAERFVPEPFAEGVSGGRLYRTGDLARLLPSGELAFLGRNDHQVKIRGFRIELGEIQAVLSDHPAVLEAAVLSREDTLGEPRLVAYLVAETAPNVDELRQFLAARLPEYMLPSAFVPLDAFPLTDRGKLDRAALPAPGSERPELEQEYVAPRNEVETLLAEVWTEVLGLDQIGIHDSFFALGGDSIRSVQVVALAREKGIELTVEQLFERLTIARLAEEAVVAEAAGDDDADLADLIGDLENLSDEEIQARLAQELAAAEQNDHE